MTRLIAALALIVPFVLTACGAEEAGTAETPAETTAPEATPEVTAEVVSATPEATAATSAASAQPSSEVKVDPKTGFSVNSSSIPTAVGTFIGGINAWCEPADSDHVRPGANVSPQVGWELAPEGTKSFALLAWDPDAPLGSGVFNKEGLTIPMEEPRSDFYHWVLVDIPISLGALEEGVEGSGVPDGARPPKRTDHGLQGLSDFSKSGPAVGGYAGPCPPWNDARVHRYTFAMYALDVETLGLSGSFYGPDVKAAMEGHVLAEASFTGLYWINPAIRLDVQ